MIARRHIASQRQVARRVLDLYGLERPGLRLIKAGSTTTFGVRAADGQRFVLRLQPAERMPWAAVRSELEWLEAIRARTPLHVPRPVPTLGGQIVVRSADYHPGAPHFCALFGWIAGRRVAHPTAAVARRMGATLGALHRFASSYQPPADFARWRFDQRSLAEQAAILERADADLLGATDRAMLQAAVRWARSRLADLDAQPDEVGLIHADTNLTNWLLCGERAALLDFEGCCFGYYVFDIGRLLHEFAQIEPAVDLAGAFHAGYAAVRPIPPLHDERIRAGMLMSLLDTVFWALSLEPWVRQAWGDQRLQAAIGQVRRMRGER